MRRSPELAATLFAMGCHGSTTFTDAAPNPDSHQVDGNVAPQPITVTTYSRYGSEPNHTLEPDIQVIAFQPDGTPGDSGTTDAQGTITLDGVQSGGFVTAIYPTNATDYQVVTVVGVKPGDNLIFGDEYTLPHGGATGTMTVDFPAVTNSAQFEAYDPCGSTFVQGTGLTSLTTNTTCDATSGDFFLLAEDATGAILATGTIHGAPYGNGLTANLAAWTTVATPNVTLSVAGLSPTVTGATLHAATVTDGTAYPYSGQVYPTLTAGAGSDVTAVPNGGDRLFTYSQIYGDTASFGEKETFQTASNDTRSASFGEPPLPWLGPVTYDAAGQSVSWTEQGTGNVDAVSINTSWSETDASQVVHNYSWHLLMPPSATSFSWSTPPPALAAYLPAATDAPFGQVELIDLSTASSYDELRQAPEWQLTCVGCVTESGELAPGSSVALQQGAEGFTALRAPTSHR